MEAVVEEEGGKVKVEEEAGGMESREGGNAGNCQGKGERTFFPARRKAGNKPKQRDRKGNESKAPISVYLLWIIRSFSFRCTT